MSKIDLISNDWVDLIFEGKNQAYGAYKLRKGTSRRNIISIIIAVVVALLAFSVIAIKKIVDANTEKVASTQVTELSNLEQKQKKAEVKKPIKVLRLIFGEEGEFGTSASSNVVTSATFVTAIIFSAAT